VWLTIVSIRDDTNPFMKRIKNNSISLYESCPGYVEGDEYKVLSRGKYGGYPNCGQTKPYEYSYVHYVFHPYGVR